MAMEITKAMLIFRLLMELVLFSLMALIVCRYKKTVASRRMPKAIQITIFSDEFIIASWICHPLP